MSACNADTAKAAAKLAQINDELMAMFVESVIVEGDGLALTLLASMWNHDVDKALRICAWTELNMFDRHEGRHVVTCPPSNRLNAPSEAA